MRLVVLAALAVMLAGCGGCASSWWQSPPVFVSADKLCKSWRHQPTHKGDKLTDKTAAGIEGNNEARPAWGCERGANRAKK
jgi:hypothetical protein